jgi:5'-methylthioadenosine phosphorylase
VTDYDCWHEDHEAVTVDAVVKVLLQNADNARNLVKAVIPRLTPPREVCAQGCERALDYAIITAPEARDAEVLAMLDAVAGRVLAA